MKILVSAIACNPVWGSEASVGWRSVRLLARRHEVWVITHAENQSCIEKVPDQVPSSLHFLYHGRQTVYHRNRLLARIQSWIEYARWSRGILKIARDLNSRVNFDICHHITYVSWRIASPFAELGIPFVWGPLGGGELFPWALAGELTAGSRLFEALREVSNRLGIRSAKIRRCARRAAHIFSANAQTTEVLAGLRGSRKDISQLAGTFFDKAAFLRFETPAAKNLHDSSLCIFAGGNLEGRKGIALALKGLRRAKDAGVAFRFLIGGNGGERFYLVQLAQNLGISDWVEFTDGYSGVEYVEKLQASHVYLVPSLRDNAPLTLMEAMLCRAVPIVLKCGGPGEIVNADCGFAIEPRSPTYVIESICAALILLNGNRALLGSLGNKSRQHIGLKYGEDRYQSECECVYERVNRLALSSKG